jgi:hypothetical protein
MNSCILESCCLNVFLTWSSRSAVLHNVASFPTGITQRMLYSTRTITPQEGAVPNCNPSVRRFEQGAGLMSEASGNTPYMDPSQRRSVLHHISKPAKEKADSKSGGERCSE